MGVQGGVGFRPLPCFSGAEFDTHSHSLKPSFSGLSVDAGNRLSGERRLLGSRDSKVSVRPRKISGFSSCAFSSNGHLQYYVSPRSGGKNKEKEKGSKMVTVKKKLKLIKGLSKDLSMFSGMGFGVEAEDGLIGEVKGKMISDAAEVLLAQLQQLRAEEKDLKKKRKEEKAKLKGTRMKASSSSESSDSESGDVVDMTLLRSKALLQSKVDEPKQEIQETATSTSLSFLIQEENIVKVEGFEDCSLQNLEEECCTGIDTSRANLAGVSSNGQSSVVVGASAERIEVCMGGKCKKSGAAALLEEFARRVGAESAVVGCKCMGKCRDGPNVRVLNCCDEIQAEEADGMVRLPANPLCIGVGLEDVSTIVANFFGEDRNDLSLMAASLKGV